jgi:hypothetical protein
VAVGLVLFEPTDFRETETWSALATAHDAGKASIGFSSMLLQDDMALDWLHTSLTNQDYKAVGSWYTGATTITAAPIGNWSTNSVTEVAPIMFSIPQFAIPTDRAADSAWGIGFSAASPLSFCDLPLLNAGTNAAIGQPISALGPWHQSNGQPAAQPGLPFVTITLPTRRTSHWRLPLADFVQEVVEALFRTFRKPLLRKLRRVRARRRSGSDRTRNLHFLRPNMISFILILLAACRRFGHREEPGDHTLPALMPISVVIGEAASSV